MFKFLLTTLGQEAGSSKSYTIGQDGSDLKRVTFNVAPDDGVEIYVINPRENCVNYG